LRNAEFGGSVDSLVIKMEVITSGTQP